MQFNNQLCWAITLNNSWVGLTDEENLELGVAGTNIDITKMKTASPMTRTQYRVWKVCGAGVRNRARARECENSNRVSRTSWQRMVRAICLCRRFAPYLNVRFCVGSWIRTVVMRPTHCCPGIMIIRLTCPLQVLIKTYLNLTNTTESW